MRKLLISFATALSLLPTWSFAQKLDFCKLKTQNRVTELFSKNQNNNDIQNVTLEQLSSTFHDNKHWLNKNIMSNSLKEQNLNENAGEKNREYMILIVYILSMYCFGIGYPLKIEYEEIKDYMKKMKIRLDSSDNFKEILQELIELYNLEGIEVLFWKFAKSFEYNYMFRLNNKSDTWSWKINRKAVSDVFRSSFKKTFYEYCKEEPDESRDLCDVLIKKFIDYLENDKKELSKTLFFKRCLR